MGIPLDWLNLSRQNFEVKCKGLFLESLPAAAKLLEAIAITWRIKNSSLVVHLDSAHIDQPWLLYQRSKTSGQKIQKTKKQQEYIFRTKKSQAYICRSYFLRPQAQCCKPQILEDLTNIVIISLTFAL